MAESSSSRKASSSTELANSSMIWHSWTSNLDGSARKPIWRLMHQLRGLELGLAPVGKRVGRFAFFRHPYYLKRYGYDFPCFFIQVSPGFVELHFQRVDKVADLDRHNNLTTKKSRAPLG